MSLEASKAGEAAVDQADSAAAPPQEPLSPLMALVLSLLVLPGLGQMLTGRKIRGLVMAGALALWLPLAIIKIGLDLNKMMPELMARAADGQAVGLVDLQELMSPMAGGLIWLFLPLAAVWLWALVDSIIYLRSKKSK
jgi:TM2 domain-containing membrane protein YozV